MRRHQGGWTLVETGAALAASLGILAVIALSAARFQRDAHSEQGIAAIRALVQGVRDQHSDGVNGYPTGTSAAGQWQRSATMPPGLEAFPADGQFVLAHVGRLGHRVPGEGARGTLQQITLVFDEPSTSAESACVRLGMALANGARQIRMGEIMPVGENGPLRGPELSAWWQTQCAPAGATMVVEFL